VIEQVIEQVAEPATDPVDPAPEQAAAETNEATETIIEQAAPSDTNANGEAAPTFDLIRIDNEGSAVFAGRARPNSNVEILANGQVIGSVNATSSGEFVALLNTPPSATPQAIEILTTAVDGSVARSSAPVIVLGRAPAQSGAEGNAINPSEAETVMPVVVRTDGEEIEIIQAPKSLGSNQVTLDTITYDAQSDVVLAGRGQPGRGGRRRSLERGAWQS